MELSSGINVDVLFLFRTGMNAHCFNYYFLIFKALFLFGLLTFSDTLYLGYVVVKILLSLEY